MDETLNVLGAPMTVKREAGLFVADHAVPPGYFVPPHRHDTDEEMFLVVEGEIVLMGADGESKAGPSRYVRFAPGELHGYRNDGEEAARVVVMATPGLQLPEMFRHFDRAAKAGPLAPPEVMAIAGEYGVHFG